MDLAVVSENGGGSLAPALAGAFFVFFVHFVEAVSVSVALKILLFYAFKLNI